MHDSPVDESLLILRFVVLPVMLLLVTGIFLAYRSQRRRTHISLPGFTLDISSLGHSGERYVTYRRGDFRLHLFAQEGVDREKRKNIFVELPNSLSEEKLTEVWSDLERGFAKLGYTSTASRPPR